jgi:hypothetical protein
MTTLSSPGTGICTGIRLLDEILRKLSIMKPKISTSLGSTAEITKSRDSILVVENLKVDDPGLYGRFLTDVRSLDTDLIELRGRDGLSPNIKEDVQKIIDDINNNQNGIRVIIEGLSNETLTAQTAIQWDLSHSHTKSVTELIKKIYIYIERIKKFKFNRHITITAVTNNENNFSLGSHPLFKHLILTQRDLEHYLNPSLKNQKNQKNKNLLKDVPKYLEVLKEYKTMITNGKVKVSTEPGIYPSSGTGNHEWNVIFIVLIIMDFLHDFGEGGYFGRSYAENQTFIYECLQAVGSDNSSHISLIQNGIELFEKLTTDEDTKGKDRKSKSLKYYLTLARDNLEKYITNHLGVFFYSPEVSSLVSRFTESSFTRESEEKLPSVIPSIFELLCLLRLQMKDLNLDFKYNQSTGTYDTSMSKEAIQKEIYKLFPIAVVDTMFSDSGLMNAIPHVVETLGNRTDATGDSAGLKGALNYIRFGNPLSYLDNTDKSHTHPQSLTLETPLIIFKYRTDTSNFDGYQQQYFPSPYSSPVRVKLRINGSEQKRFFMMTNTQKKLKSIQTIFIPVMPEWVENQLNNLLKNKNYKNSETLKTTLEWIIERLEGGGEDEEGGGEEGEGGGGEEGGGEGGGAGGVAAHGCGQQGRPQLRGYQARGLQGKALSCPEARIRTLSPFVDI